jgi:GNAT superfamily N-acetyltransferase
MLANANLVLSAGHGDELIGIARSVTDLAWCRYRADLAVARPWQGRGLATGLLRRTREAIGPGCSLVPVSAPEAVDWHPKVGLERLDRGFIVPRQG